MVVLEYIFKNKMSRIVTMEYSQDQDFAVSYDETSDVIQDVFTEYSKEHGNGGLTTEQLERTIDILDSRYGLEKLAGEELELSEYGENGVKIELESFDDTPIYASEQHCVTHGNDILDDDRPPEGPAKDGQGNSIYGVR